MRIKSIRSNGFERRVQTSDLRDNVDGDVHLRHSPVPMLKHENSAASQKDGGAHN